MQTRLEDRPTVPIHPTHVPQHAPRPADHTAKHRKDGCAVLALGLVASAVIILTGLATIVLAIVGEFR